MDPALSSPACLTVHVCFPGARTAVMDNLNRQREEGRLCDLSIQVQGQVFRAHRCVLAASSPYFHDQVLLKNVTTVSLPSVMDPVAFESVLSSAYTGQLSLVHEDIVNYVTVASFLQMWHIVDKCTEILKRPRPPLEVAAAAGEGAGAPPGTASRQQSPSSTDCLYLETESRKKERKPDALPPLATWRRPQQFPRWGRARPPPAQQRADSQLHSQAAFAGGDFSSGEEAWEPAHAKNHHLAQDAAPHAGRLRAGGAGPESGRQRARLQQRGAPSSTDPERGDSHETPERRKDERRESEADEGVGEDQDQDQDQDPDPDVAAKKDSCSEIRLCGFHPGPAPGAGPGPTPGPGPRPGAGPGAGPGPGTALDEAAPEDLKASVQSELLPSSGSQREDGVPGPSCPVPGQPQWQMGPWAQQEEGGALCGQDLGAGQQQDQVDFFSDATFSRDTYDEIEDGTGRVSQRPLLPASPDLAMAAPEVDWSGSLGFSSHPQASSPPSPCPSSSSAVGLAGAPYRGKVHLCHCGKAYTLKSMRDRHVKMQHLNLRPFGCPVCTKSFKMKHHLTKHLKTHGGLRPYECSLCGKKVVWRDSFLRHQARCERLASSSSTSTSSTAQLEDAYAFQQGQVKVEDVDFHRDIEDGMSGLLGSVSGMVEQLRGRSEAGGQVFKEEAREGFSGGAS